MPNSEESRWRGLVLRDYGSDYSYSTDDEQYEAIENAHGTGINPHAYQGQYGDRLVSNFCEPEVWGSPLYECNAEPQTMYGGQPVINYPPDALLNQLPVYKKTRQGIFLLETYREFIWSGDYFPYIINLPYNQVDNLITFRKTLRDQISVPVGSYLVAIQSYAVTTEGEAFVVPTTCRLQFYDDGAGEYVEDKSVRDSITAGNTRPIAASGNAFGPFVLPSPLAVCKPGSVVANISNVELTGIPNSETSGAIRAYVALIFAVPRSTMQQRDVRYENN